MPGLVLLTNVRSCRPTPVVRGDPMLRPPVTVRQFVLSTKPMLAQVWLIWEEAWTPAPGKVRNFCAIGPPLEARESNWGVSYQPVLVEVLLLLVVS